MFTDPLVQIIILIAAMNAIGGAGVFINKRLTPPNLTGSVFDTIQQDNPSDMVEILKSIDAKLGRLEEIEIYRFKRELKAQKGKVA